MHAVTQQQPPPWYRRLRWRVELFGWQVVAALLWYLGHRRTVALGEAVGRLLPRVAPRRLRVATDDLRRVFGTTKPESEIDAIARRSLATLGGTIAEFLWLQRAAPADIAALVEIDERARSTLREATSCGRGVILVAIHFSRWELMFLGFNLTGQRFTVITHPLENPYLDAYLSGIRCRFGNAFLHTGHTRAMHAALSRGDTLLISMDHRSQQRQAAVVDFLGLATPLTTGIARLALRHDAILLPIYGLPLPDGRLKIEIGPSLEYTSNGKGRRDVERITQQSADVLGAVIRQHPQYWMWSHKRLWGRQSDSA